MLVVVHTPDAFSPLQIAEAADGICRSLWIIDASARSDPGYRRVMSKFGQVIDHAALTLDQLVDEVAALEPSGIVAFTDDGQVLTASLAQRLGLEFHPVEVVERLIDKVAQRRALAAAGFEAVGEHRLSSAHRWTVDDLIGFTYSTSFLPRHVLGASAADFEADLHAALDRFEGGAGLHQVIDFAYELYRRPAITE